MFTGIIEEIGTIQSITKNAQAYQFRIHCQKVLSDVSIGDSIAVNGVCLTVNHFDRNSFTVDIMPETVHATTIEELSIGSHVNLERAMAANGRFGGHFVSGHVDGTGEIQSISTKHNARIVEIRVDSQFHKYFMDKGSVAVDGTSLTIFGITANGFIISLIPVTQDDSVIGYKKVGDRVNIECDVLMKYMDRLLHKNKEKETDTMMQTLQDSGFLG